MVQSYSITIKINKKGPTSDEYYDLIERLYREDGIFIDSLTFETDKKYNLHVHGIFSSNQKIIYSSLTKKYKVHIYITRLNNDELRIWEKYIKKQRYKQLSILALNPYYHHYSFIDDDQTTA